MDRHRQIAFISAFIVALLIMMLGKSCTDSMIKKQSKPVQNNASQTSQVYDNNSYNNNYSNNYINDYNNAPQTTIPHQTEIPVEYVTNMFGEVVGTAETPVTEFPETVAGDIQTTTQQRSILEQYNEEKQKNVSTYMNTPAENNNYQIPSEINITIH